MQSFRSATIITPLPAAASKSDRRRRSQPDCRATARGTGNPISPLFELGSARLWPKFEWVSDRSRRKTRGASISLRSRPSRDSKKNRRRIYLPRKCALPRVIQIGQSRAQSVLRYSISAFRWSGDSAGPTTPGPLPSPLNSCPRFEFPRSEVLNSKPLASGSVL